MNYIQKLIHLYLTNSKGEANYFLLEHCACQTEREIANGLEIAETRSIASAFRIIIQGWFCIFESSRINELETRKKVSNSLA